MAVNEHQRPLVEHPGHEIPKPGVRGRIEFGRNDQQIDFPSELAMRISLSDGLPGTSCTRTRRNKSRVPFFR